METIAIDRINRNDRTFSISFPFESPLLLSSIEKVGIVQPVLLRDGSPLTIVTGFKRVEAAVRLGHASVPALVLTALTERDALLRAIHDNLMRGLNIVEKSFALERMMGLGFSMDEVYGTMALFGLKPHEKILRTFLAIAYGEEALKAFIIARNLSLTNIEGLLRFDPTEREGLLAVLSSVHTTEGYLREVLTMTALMKLKEGALDFDLLSGAGDAHDLRTRLKRRIHPALSSLEDRLQGLRLQAALPPHADIKVDPFFEKEYIDIEIRARDIEDLEYSLGKLRQALENGSLGSILELTKG